MTSPDDLKELAPTGALRGGVVIAPAASAFFAIKDAQGAPRGVTVNLVSPLAATPALEQAIAEDPALGKRLAQRVPLGRIGDAEQDVGPAVAFLLSDAARYITGQTLVVDGGRFMGL